MKREDPNIFWLSYSDLMTSLFFIMLVLFAITYIVWTKDRKKLKKTIEIQKKELAIVNAVEHSLYPLKTDSLFFKYQPKYKRFTLRFAVEFARNKSSLVPGELKNYKQTITDIQKAGNKLKSIVDSLIYKKEHDSIGALKDVTYLLVIAGYASHTGASRSHNYLLSFKRAYSLWRFWKESGVDFEASKYKGLIDLQLAGNGWGGVGRVVPEVKNQRFIIQLMPKIGDLTQ